MRGVSRKFRQICVPIAGICLLTLVYLNGKAVRSRFLDSDFENSSYLSDTSYSGISGSFYGYLFGSATFGSRAAFENLYRQYEERTRYGLVDANGERAYYDQLARMSESALGEFQRFGTTSAAKGISSSASFSDIKTPAAILALMAAAYTGRMVEYRISPDLRVQSQSQIQDNRLNRQHLGLSGKTLGGSLEYIGQGSAPGLGSDDYKATVASESKVLGATAGAGYVIRSQAVTMGISKRVTENVSVSYDWVDPKASAVQHTVGLGFRAGF